jgi:hypothetical protein
VLDRRTGTARRQLTLALCLATAAALGPGAPARAADPQLLAGPDLGPDLPPAGAPLLDELFPDGLPVPFEAVLDRLRTLAGPDNVETALIPLGRSLQRYAAAPDFFASPRIVVAVTGDTAAGPGGPRLADRLFLGYQPDGAVIEAISYNAAAGRFEFQEIVGYDGTTPATAQPAERRVCLACHQGHGPIFARPLWAETNANPEVAARLAPLGDSFHGAAVRQSVDALDAFDAATDRAARIPLADRLWAEACPDRACRAALLAAAIRTGLGTLPPDPPPGFDAHAVALWPDGLATVSQDIPNRDPFLAWTEGGTDLETTGRFNPETPRAPVTLWQPGPGAFAAAAREIAAQLTPGDLDWIDLGLRGTKGPGTTLSLPCTTTDATLPDGRLETRFACQSRGTRLAGFRAATGEGRIETLALAGQPSAPAFALPPSGPPFARAADGSRIEVLTVAPDVAGLRLVDDLSVLDSRLAARAAETGAALDPGPFPRAAVLTLLAEILGGTNG